MNILFILCPLIMLAGFIDSIAGGGGLITLTAYMACGLQGPLALGTNKFSSTVGCTFASANYIRTKNVEGKSLVPAMIAALAGSFLGSRTALLLDNRVFSMILLFATPVVAALVLFDKNYDNHEKDLPFGQKVLICLVIGLVVGFYDGFYGPGTGMFLQMGFILIAGISVKKACGNARLVNWASNIAALTNFILTGNVLYAVAIPCAACSIIGNLLGSSLAIKKDVKIVKPMMLVVVALLFTKLLLDFLGVKIG